MLSPTAAADFLRSFPLPPLQSRVPPTPASPVNTTPSPTSTSPPLSPMRIDDYLSLFKLPPLPAASIRAPHTPVPEHDELPSTSPATRHTQLRHKGRQDARRPPLRPIHHVNSLAAVASEEECGEQALSVASVDPTAYLHSFSLPPIDEQCNDLLLLPSTPPPTQDEEEYEPPRPTRPVRPARDSDNELDDEHDEIVGAYGKHTLVKPTFIELKSN